MSTPTRAHARSDTPIEFELGSRRCTVEGRFATVTLLDYVRDTVGRTGTKEACRAGDCGACMVVLADRDANGVAYRAVNSCVRLLGTVHGRTVLTVEDLSGGKAADLHPVQQAMVDAQAAQCGFCTPGFVMALFALSGSIAHASDDDIRHALSGNLCRCTGYRPIIEAAQRLRTAAVAGVLTPVLPDKTPQTAPEAVEPGSTRRHGGAPAFLAPSSLEELRRVLRRWPRGTLIAGGTDLVPGATEDGRWHGPLIYLGNIVGLDTISTEEQSLVVGATAPLREVFRLVLTEYPSLTELVRRFASPAITNVATLAGNVATGSSLGDTIPLLMCLGATLTLSRDGLLRRVPVDDFYIGDRQTRLRPREFIQSIEIPRRKGDEHVRVYKVTKRFEQDTSIVLGAFRLVVKDGRVHDIRLAFGGLAARPMRARHTEDALIGRAWRRSTIDAAARELGIDFEPIDDHRGSTSFRRRVAANLLVKWYLDVAEGEPVSLWREPSR